MLSKALFKLKRSGKKLTPQRQAVLQLLAEAEQPLTAEEILEKLRCSHPHISHDTIYRTLATLINLQLVNEITFRDNCRRFEFNNTGDHHHFMVCLRCGKAWKLPDCPQECLERAKSYFPGFEISDHSFVIYGYCPNCREAERNEEA